MNVHGWSATEYVSGQMSVRKMGGWWSWRCADCCDHGQGKTAEDAMKGADAHRTSCAFALREKTADG